MSDTARKNKVQAGKNPLEQGKKTIFDFYEDYKKLLDALSFISSASINDNAEDYNLPNQNKFMHQQWNKTFLISKKKGKLNIKLVANFIVIVVKECTYIFNDKSGKKPLKHYIITLQNHNGKIEKEVEITGNSKTDFKQFQTSIKNQLNDFVVNMNEAEFKAFVAEYISPKRIEKAFEDKLDGNITPEQWKLFNDKWQAEKDKMYIQLEEINKLDKQFYEHSDTLLRFTDNAHEYYQKGSVVQRRKILEIISEKITYKDKSLNISLKPVFQTIAEKQYNLRSKLENNRTLKNSIKKGSEPNSNPDFLNGSSGGTRTYNPSVNSRMLCH